MQRRIVILVVMTAAWHGLAGAVLSASQETPTTPVVFDGLGLEDFKGSGSIASALRGIESDSKPADLPLGVPVDVVVRGPSGRGSGGDPLAAEMTSRLQGIDLTAGMQADLAAIDSGRDTSRAWVRELVELIACSRCAAIGDSAEKPDTPRLQLQL